jgi:hypothetical protein
VGTCPIDLDAVTRATACTIVRTPSLVLAFEVTRVGKAMAAERGLMFTAAKTGEYIGGTLIGCIQFAAGRFAMIDDGIGFQLVPWQPVLDKRIGQHITGIMRSAGGIEWSFGRKRGLGSECPQYRDLPIAMGPARRSGKGPRLQQHRSLLVLEPVDHVAARQGLGRIRSARAHARPGWSFRIHSENTRCATGVRRRGHPHFPVSEISRHSNGEPACAIRCTGRTPLIGVVQHFGGWRLLSEGLGRCPRRASSGFHPKRQTPFRVRGEREDGVAFSAPEKPPDACTPAARREGRVAAQCCATTQEAKAMSIDVDERIGSQIANELECGARPGSSCGTPTTLPGGSRVRCAGPAGREGVSNVAA